MARVASHGEAGGHNGAAVVRSMTYNQSINQSINNRNNGHGNPFLSFIFSNEEQINQLINE